MEDSVEQQLRELISKNLKIDRALIRRGSRLADWGGDSLLFLETIFEVESHFGIEFPESGANGVSDFDSLIALVETQLAKLPSGQRPDAAA